MINGEFNGARALPRPRPSARPGAPGDEDAAPIPPRSRGVNHGHFCAGSSSFWSIAGGLAIVWGVAGYYHLRYYVLRRHEPETWKLQPKRWLRPEQQRQAMGWTTLNMTVGGLPVGHLHLELDRGLPTGLTSTSPSAATGWFLFSSAAFLRAGRPAGLTTPTGRCTTSWCSARSTRGTTATSPPPVRGHGHAPGRVLDLSRPSPSCRCSSCRSTTSPAIKQSSSTSSSSTSSTTRA